MGVPLGDAHKVAPLLLMPPSGAVYGKTCQQAMKLHGLQKGQRVCFDVKCVCEIRYHSDSEDEDDD